MLHVLPQGVNFLLAVQVHFSGRLGVGGLRFGLIEQQEGNEDPS